MNYLFYVIGRNLPIIFCFTALNLLRAQYSVELRDGSQLNCKRIEVRGDGLLISVDHGTLSIPKASLGSASLKKYYNIILERVPELMEQKVVKPVRSELAKAVSPAPPMIKGGENCLGCDSESGDLPTQILRKALSPGGGKYLSRPFEFEFNLIGSREKYTVQGYLPISKNNEPPTSASNIVFYAPYMGYKALLSRVDGEKNVQAPKTELDKMLKRFSDSFGMTVFTVLFKGEPEIADDRNRCYYYPESGAFDVVFKVKEKIVRDYKLEQRKLYIFGYSGGGSMAERMAVLRPSEVAACAVFGGGRFDPIVKRLDVPILVVHTRGDIRASKNIQLAKEGWRVGTNLLYAQTEPVAATKNAYLTRNGVNFHHEAAKIGFDICQEYLTSVCLQNEQGRSLEEWPLKVRLSSIFKLETDIRGSSTLGDGVYLPSEAFGKLWESLPYRSIRIPVEYDNSILISSVRYATTPSTKGIVILDTGEGITPSDQYDLSDYIAQKGYICVTANFSSNELRHQIETKALLRWLVDNQAFNSYPLMLVGFGSGGRHLIVASQLLANRKNATVFSYRSQYDWPIEQLSPLNSLSTIKADIVVGIVDGKTNNKSEISAFIAEAAKNGVSARTADCKTTDSKLEYFDILDVALE